MIDERKCSFFGGEGGGDLLHCALIFNEVVDKAMRKKKKCMILEVDYVKVHDSVCWKLLLYMMRRLGSHDLWIR